MTYYISGLLILGKKLFFKRYSNSYPASVRAFHKKKKALFHEKKRIFFCPPTSRYTNMTI
ncbi:MAG: hypothetical protein C4522_01135 [Desulfobacteraceae bacterium]|nr:MAG: hypothetical protein C4522_01135 [Desulfobacteraceae bacterium]